MLRPEAVKMLTTFGRVLRAMYPDMTYTISGEEVVEVSIKDQENTPLLLFQVDDEVLSLRFGGNLYQQVQTVYDWETLTELLVIYISLVYPVYADRLTISKFLSALFGLKVRNWADLLGRLLFGLDVSSSKVGNTFFIDQFSIIADSREVILDGPIDASREYVSDLSLCKTVLSYFSIILQSLDLEVVLWDEDVTSLETPEESDEEAPPAGGPPPVDNDIDIDLPPDEGAPEEPTEESPETLELPGEDLE